MKECAAVGLIALLSSCGVGGVTIDVFPDGSGKYEISKLEATFSTGEKVDGIKGLQAVDKSKIFIDTTSCYFAKLSELQVDGMKLAWTANENAFQLEATIATTADAAWFKALEITEEKLKKAEEQGKKMLDEMGMGMFVSGDKLTAVTITVKMPGNVSEAKIVEPAAPPQTWTVETKGDEEAQLSIPCREIMKGAVKEIKLCVKCGELSAKRQTEWDTLKKKLEGKK